MKSNLLFGNDVIHETILDLKFEISMNSFFQTNPKSAEKLYSKVYDYVFDLNKSNKTIIIDLFCGTGQSLRLLLAKILI